MNPGEQRKVQRAVHLATGLIVLLYVYAPLQDQLQQAIRFVVLPVLVATGIAMWKAARIRRMSRRLHSA